MNFAIVVALFAIAATASETAAVRSCESACCASSCATTFPKCASKCCSPFITAADACDSCLSQAGCSPHPPTPTPPTPTLMAPRADPQSWAELTSASALGGTIHLSPDFEMGDYTKAIDFSGKVLVIWGSNATLDAAGKGQFFTGDGSKGMKTSLELHGLVMQNGKADDAVSDSNFDNTRFSFLNSPN